MADSQETDDIDRVEMKNKEELYGKIREQGVGDSEAYYAAFRQMYFCDGIFKAKKSKDLLEKVMLEIHPSLQYSEQSELILQAFSKVFLIELFEESISVRQQMGHSKNIDEEILIKSFLNLKEKFNSS